MFRRTRVRRYHRSYNRKRENVHYSTPRGRTMHDVTLGYAIAAAILVIAAVLFYKSKAKFDTNLFGFKIPDGKMYRFTLTPPLANDTWAIQALSFQTSDLTRFFAFV